MVKDQVGQEALFAGGYGNGQADASGKQAKLTKQLDTQMVCHIVAPRT